MDASDKRFSLLSFLSFLSFSLFFLLLSNSPLHRILALVKNQNITPIPFSTNKRLFS